MELRTCLRCLAEVRRDLVTVGRLFALLPSMLGHLPGGQLDSIMGQGNEPGMPGGDILAMLGPGSAATGDGGDLVGRPAGEPLDPPPVSFELGTWVEGWSERRRETVRLSATVAAKVEWLSVRAGWASEHHEAFPYFASDVRRIVARLEDATGTSERPEHGPPCPYCRASLLREWTDQGLADDWVCGRCRRAFGPAQYRLAVLASLEAQGGA